MFIKNNTSRTKKKLLWLVRVHKILRKHFVNENRLDNYPTLFTAQPQAQTLPLPGSGTDSISSLSYKF